MADYHTTYKGPKGETTEWDDIQRKHGNLPPKEPVWKPDAYTPEDIENTKKTQFLDSKSEEELRELEDDYSDDRFLEEYRRRRLEELQKGKTRPRFGTVESIRQSEFVSQVTNAGDDVWVVCHLYKDAVGDCAILNQCLVQLAERYPNTKFVKIISTDCIPGYPDENLPTILIYHDTKCIKSLVGLNAVGGKGTSPDRVAMALNCYGRVCGDTDQEVEAQIRGVVEDILEERARAVVARLKRGESDEDSDFES